MCFAVIRMSLIAALLAQLVGTPAEQLKMRMTGNLAKDLCDAFWVQQALT